MLDYQPPWGFVGEDGALTQSVAAEEIQNYHPGVWMRAVGGASLTVLWSVIV